MPRRIVARCLKCRGVKPVIEFCHSENYIDGKGIYCNSCIKKYGESLFSKVKKIQTRVFGKQKNYMQIFCDAIRRGTLVRPDRCELCNSHYKHIHGHHVDYSRPIDVVWLCPLCHRRIHLLLKEISKNQYTMIHNPFPEMIKSIF